MIILGIDPGIAIVGWGVIRFENSKATALDYGSVMTGPEFSVEERLEIINDRLDSIIKKYRPDAVSVEELFWNTNQKTGIIVAEARGTILLCARKNGIEIFEYTPLQVKQSVTGYGRAEKKQIISLVTMMLGLTILLMHLRLRSAMRTVRPPVSESISTHRQTRGSDGVSMRMNVISARQI